MIDDSADDARTTAVAQLGELGLSTYAARTFVALVSIGEGTAADVSAVADVPRTRVYDAATELQERGLVDVKQSNPRRFWAISTETAGRHFEKEYSHRVSVLTDALDELSVPRRTNEQRGVWTVTGRRTVSERIEEFISSAEDEVVYMTVDELLTDDIAASLSRASGRGVTIRLAEMSDTTEDQFREQVPDAALFDSLWDWSDTPAGRLLMVDQRKTLVSVLVSDSEEETARDETAIWGSGSDNSLVVILRAIFTWQLDDDRS